PLGSLGVRFPLQPLDGRLTQIATGDGLGSRRLFLESNDEGLVHLLSLLPVVSHVPTTSTSSARDVERAAVRSPLLPDWTHASRKSERGSRNSIGSAKVT